MSSDSDTLSKKEHERMLELLKVKDQELMEKISNSPEDSSEEKELP